MNKQVSWESHGFGDACVPRSEEAALVHIIKNWDWECGTTTGNLGAGQVALWKERSERENREGDREEFDSEARWLRESRERSSQRSCSRSRHGVDVIVYM